VPLALVLLVALHLVALRQVGSNNPDGIEIKANKGPDGKPVDGIPFHPYYTVKDIVGLGVFLIAVLRWCCSSYRRSAGLFLEAPNFEPANAAVRRRLHIAPVWYFTPFYAMLRAVPDQQLGALLMALSLIGFFLLPWLDRSPVKSTRYRPLTWKIALTVFTISFVALGYLGLKPAEGSYVLAARIFTGLYFAFFVLMPFYTRGESTSRVPARVTFHHD
jgi:ubiquinol-cytochrome c reductase cytochrome b subunit